MKDGLTTAALQEARRVAAATYQVCRLDGALLPLGDEMHLTAWRGYAAEAGAQGVFPVLCERLPQFWFPVRPGIAATDDYRAALYRGAPRDSLADAPGLKLVYPDELRLVIHTGPAGAVPVLLPRGREDFLTLFFALSCRHEPRHVPDSVGAAMIIGFNNWDRIRSYRRTWEDSAPPDAYWSDEFRRLTARKECYQDRLLLVSDGPYSAVPAESMGLSEAEWRQASIQLRTVHECAHMLTYRLLKPDGKSLLDEFIADILAIVAVGGRFRPQWLLQFWGLDSPAGGLAGSRLAYYAPQADEAEQRRLAEWIVGLARDVETLFEMYGTGWPVQLAVVNALLGPSADSA